MSDWMLLYLFTRDASRTDTAKEIGNEVLAAIRAQLRSAAK